jgi:outer membrane protein
MIISFCNKQYKLFRLKEVVMLRSAVRLSVILTLLGASVVSAQQTPPIMPKFTEPVIPEPVSVTVPVNQNSKVSERPLTIDEAIAIVLREQPGITAAKAGVLSAQGRVQVERSNLLPTVAVEAGHDHVNGDSSGRDGFEVSASIQQLIYDFNYTRNLVKQASADKRAAESNLTRVQSDTVLLVKQAFYTYAQNQRLVEVNESNLRNQQSHVDLAQARLNAGVGLPSDVVRAKTAVSDAVLKLNQAHTNALTARINLALRMGIDPRTPIQIAEASEENSLPDDLTQLSDLALKKRPEIAQVQANLEAARRGLGAARTTSYPSISVFSGWDQNGANWPMDNESTNLGISIKMTPFDAGLTTGRVKEAKADIQAADASLQATKLSVIADVSQSYLDLKTAEQQVVTANTEVKNAEETLRLVEGRY